MESGLTEAYPRLDEAVPDFAVGYPPRMREWTAKRKAAGETGPPTSG